MAYLLKLRDYLNKAMLVLGSIALILLMLLGTGNVLLRIFNVPYRGTYEIVSFLGAVVTAFALGYTHQKKYHIVVDIVSERYPYSLKVFLDKLSALILCIVFAVLSWQLYKWGIKIKLSGELSETLQIIYYPFVFCVSAGCAAMSFTALIDLILEDKEIR